MKKWNEGDHVKIVSRPVTEDDRKKNRYFEHMAGLTGTVQNVYEDGQLAIQVDPPSLSKVSGDVHTTATRRMWEKFSSNITEEQRKALTKEEMEFDTHYVLLVAAGDLEND
jgi:hypothetical protein